VIGSTNDRDRRPKISLAQFASFNLTISGRDANRDEFIQLASGDVDSGVHWTFSHITGQLLKGRFGFDSLALDQAKFLASKQTYGSQLSECHLATDFDSFASLPPLVEHIGPTESLRLSLPENDTRLTFRPDHSVVAATNSTAAVFDLLQIPRKPGLVVFEAQSRALDFNFEPLPETPADLPPIDFNFARTAQIFFDCEQLPDPLMDLTNLWRFSAGNTSLFFRTRPGVIRPSVAINSTGETLTNDRPFEYFDSYCLCRETCPDCHDPLVTFDQLDQTVIGNPHKSIRYIVGRSKKAKYPHFNLEHFGDRNLTVIGQTIDEHVHVFGNAADSDRGFHHFSGLNLHLGLDVKFPSVSLASVALIPDYARSSLTATHLSIDFKSFQAIDASRIELKPPIGGFQLDASNLPDEVVITLVSTRKIRVNGYNITTNLETTPEIVVKIRTSASLELGPVIRENPFEDNVPRLRIITQGDLVIVKCAGTDWPTGLADLTAKIMIEHGSGDLRVTGEPLGTTTYATAPALLAHEGTGPVFFNRVLLGFQESYCICAGATCAADCGKTGPVIGFADADIRGTLVNNPHRMIQYHIRGSSPTSRANFAMANFYAKSFLITGDDERAFVALEGSAQFTDSTTTSVSQTFMNLEISFAAAGYYNFNNVVFENVNVTNTDAPRDSRKVLQRGMTIDISSLIALHSQVLMLPPTLYLMVLGGSQLSEIASRSSDALELVSQGHRVPIDLSMLAHPVTIGAHDFDVLKLSWEYTGFKTITPPTFRIDVRDTVGEAATILFNGRQWAKPYHRLEKQITIIHGQVKLNLDAGSGAPPEVTLEGDGDCYINGKKRLSPLGLKIHGEDESLSDSITWLGWFVRVICVGILAVVLFYFWRWTTYRRVPLALQGNKELGNFSLDPEIGFVNIDLGRISDLPRRDEFQDAPDE
jgi:hypothetical protein